jgi:hypothetical protein
MATTKPRRRSRPKDPKVKPGRGQFSDYDRGFHPKAAYKHTLLGATMEELAEAFGIGLSTLYDWQTRNPELREAIHAGREPADAEVSFGLFKRASGATVKKQTPIKVKHTEYDPKTGRKVKEWEEVVMVDTEEELPTDTHAARFWLNNRSPKRWRDKSQLEVTGKDDGPIEVTPVRERISSRIAGIASRVSPPEDSGGTE